LIFKHNSPAVVGVNVARCKQPDIPSTRDGTLAPPVGRSRCNNNYEFVMAAGAPVCRQTGKQKV